MHPFNSGRRWNIVRFTFPFRQRTTKTCWNISMWTTSLRMWVMREIAVLLMHISRPWCQPKLKTDLLKSKQRAERKSSIFFYLNPIQTGGGGAFRTPPPSGKIVITFTPKELWRSNFLTFPKIYLGTFCYNYHVHAINHVAMATSFWHIGFGKCKKWWIFCFKIMFLHL